MKRPTQADVARHAGVSKATVSYVLNQQTNGRMPISQDTRQRVLDAIEQLDYEPDARAQALRSGSTNTIGLIIPDLSNPHFCEYATGIEQEAHNSGYQVLLSNTMFDEEYALDTFKSLSQRRIDGLILASSFIVTSEEPQKTLAQLRARRFPIVEMDDQYNVDCVVCDYRQATQEVLDYLLSLGHQRIGFVCGVHVRELGMDRLAPYQDTLKKAGLFDPALLAECGPTIEDGYQAALRLLRLTERPSALISINDLLAIGILRAAGDLGLTIPRDLSLVGYDDIPMAQYMVPRLTTVSKDTFRAGQAAFKLLLTRMQNPDLPRQRQAHPARFIIRESTGPAPNS